MIWCALSHFEEKLQGSLLQKEVERTASDTITTERTPIFKNSYSNKRETKLASNKTKAATSEKKKKETSIKQNERKFNFVDLSPNNNRLYVDYRLQRQF